MKKIALGLLLIALTSCSYYISKVDENSVTKAPTEKKLSILFSHNISGETHPCGCRNFPLGGLPQIAGLFANISKDSEIIYVDTGDTFFPSSVIPKTMTTSLSFAAENLSRGLEQVGLKYFVPGDQDFAMGIEFLRDLALKSKFDFLISNLKNESLLKHKRYAIIDRGQTKIFLVGLVDPEAMLGESANYFMKPEEALPRVIDEIAGFGYNKSNPYHRLIVLSHAGIEPDTNLAKSFPYIDWIIGAHSQSFLRYSQDEGNVKMVQVLSKNHYIGDITIDLNSKKQTDTYKIDEIRDELEKNLNPNPMRAFIDDHKMKMNDLQLKEQAMMGGIAPHGDVKKYKTAASCIECHKPQGDFWQGTAHSIAYTTLINVKEPNNLTCVQCHSLGLNDPKGFSSPTKDMVSFKKKPLLSYWNEVQKMGSHLPSVRSASPEERKKVSVQWLAFDKKNSVTHNFANVQCLNCHTQEDTHPKNTEPKKSLEVRNTAIKNKCLSCHTTEQSPEWYDNGLKVNAKFDESYKKVSCPKL
jgi:nitrate/TMAO reductase-like tetraheme cytochrome c subunit